MCNARSLPGDGSPWRHSRSGKAGLASAVRAPSAWLVRAARTGGDICRSPVVLASHQVKYRGQAKDKAHRAAEHLPDDARAIAGCVGRSYSHTVQPYPPTGQHQLDDDNPDNGSLALRHRRYFMQLDEAGARQRSQGSEARFRGGWRLIILTVWSPS